MIRAEAFTEASAFRERVHPFLAAREAEHNLLFGVMDGISSGRYPDFVLAAALDGDAPVAVAVRTPPFGAILSCVDDPRATDVLCDHLLAHDPGNPGLLGPKQHAAAFARRWTAATGRTAEIHMAQRIHSATTAQRPEGVPGRTREASTGDRDLVIAWYRAFMGEVDVGARPESVEETVDRRLAAPVPELFVWEDDGAACLAGIGGPTPNGLRVGPVYTPPESRGRGYATALVAEVTARALDGGRRFVFLFTDLANPTSNRIYARIGYRPVLDVDQYRFSATEP